MKLFVDSADRAAWKDLASSGLFSGVTTNPLLLQRTGLRCEISTLAELYGAAMDFGFREIQMQSWGGTSEKLGVMAERLADFGPEVVVKLPATAQGFAAAQQLRRKRPDTRVTMTAVYTPGQVVAAAAFGAAYAAPYYARLKEAGEDADGAFTQMLAAAGTQTELLVASLRNADQVVQLTGQGHRCFTLPPAVAAELLQSDLSARAVAEFEVAANDG